MAATMFLLSKAWNESLVENVVGLERQGVCVEVDLDG